MVAFVDPPKCLNKSLIESDLLSNEESSFLDDHS